MKIDSSPATGSHEFSDYYFKVERAFDSVSEKYDRHIESNFINRWMREISIATLLRTFQGHERILDIGCGTGIESLPLARRGVSIVALDVSRNMLKKLRSKADEAGVSDRITTRQLPAHGLEHILEEFGEASFDGAFSNFGALNLEPQLGRLPHLLHKLIADGGRFVCAVWNKFCLFEMLAYASMLRIHKALGRLRNPVNVPVTIFKVPTYFYSVAEFEKLFRPKFHTLQVTGIPVVLPPSNFSQYYVKIRRLTGCFEKVDRALNRRSPFNRLGDHFLIEMAKN